MRTLDELLNHLDSAGDCPVCLGTGELEEECSCRQFDCRCIIRETPDCPQCCGIGVVLDW